MHRQLCLLIALLVPVTAWAIPEPEDFYVREEFPTTPAFGWVGTAQPTSSLFLVYDGETVYRQETDPRAVLEPIATGFTGDPGFIAIRPSGTRAVIGGGSNGLVYFLDLLDPQDFVPGEAIDIGSHFSGVMLNENLLAVDRGAFGFPAEIAIFDLTPTTRGTREPFVVLQRPADEAERQVVIEKPAGSFSASLGLTANLQRLYVTDAGNGEVRWFSVSALINAFNTMTEIPWSDGTLLGEPFDYPIGGIYGFTFGGNAVFAGNGSIATVNLNTGDIVTELDPAGTMPFYTLIYNPFTEEMIAIESGFPDPDVIYATRNGLPPRRPCDTQTEVQDQYNDLVSMFSLGDDIDGDGLPDEAMLELILQYSCQTFPAEAVDATALAYEANYLTMQQEPGLATLEPFMYALLTMLTQSADMEAALKAVPGLPITLDYVAPECSAADRCMPAFGTGDAAFMPEMGEVFEELYLSTSDTDFDDVDNQTEFDRITAIGGSFLDFAINALNPALDGSGGVRVTSDSSCFLATAAYGTPSHPKLDRLRNFRDQVLLRSALGTAFTDTYYSLSPPMARYIAERPVLRAGVRGVLNTGFFAVDHAVLTAIFVVMLFYMAVRRRLARAPGREGSETE